MRGNILVVGGSLMAFAGFISYSKVGCISGERFILISDDFPRLQAAGCTMHPSWP